MHTSASSAKVHVANSDAAAAPKPTDKSATTEAPTASSPPTRAAAINYALVQLVRPYSFFFFLRDNTSFFFIRDYSSSCISVDIFCYTN
jgi:hypothetical protein